MNTKISLFTLFACALAGTSLLADNENYDGKTIASGTSFSGKSLVDSSWIVAIIGDSSGYVCFDDADLSGANFTSATITKGYFTTDDTYGATNLTNLTNAVFAGATITNSTFSGTMLTKAVFTNATITNPHFSDADLSGANFTNATFTNATSTITGGVSESYFTCATLTNANFTNAKVGDSSNTVYFKGSDLTGANFTNSTITKCDFSTDSTYGATNLTDAVFTGATITGSSYFNGATLTNANFENAKIGDSSNTVYFKGSDLTGANFTNSTITKCDFSTDSTYGATNLTDAVFTGATITGSSYFNGATLTNANFENAKIGDSSNTVYFKGSDLTGANFTNATIAGCYYTDGDYGTTNLTDAVFTGATITDSKFYGASLTGANFTNSTITKCDFSTDSTYGATNLTDAVFTGATITGSSYFNGATLTNANFENAKIGDSSNTVYFKGSDLTGANFTNATIAGCYYTDGDYGTTNLTDAVFTGATITDSKFYGASLTGANFMNATIEDCDETPMPTQQRTNLTNAVFEGATISGSWYFFCGATLTNANFKNAKINNREGCHEISFQGANLTGANFENAKIGKGSFVDFTDANLTGANFMNAECGIYFSRSPDITRADFRGSSGFWLYSNVALNTLWPDGRIYGFSMTSEEDSFSIAKHVPKEGAESVSAKLASSATISGGAVLTLANGSAFEVIDGATLTIGENGSVVFGENTALHFGVSESAASSIVVADSGSVVFSDTTKLVVDFSGEVADVSYALLTWTDSASVSDLSALTKGSNISLLVDGIAYADELWDFSTANNALTISIRDNKSILINELEQIVNLKTDEYVGTFDASLTEFRGTISGEGSVRSGYALTFAGDASAHTGTTYIDGGIFTIVDAAKLGTGAFEVASAGALRIEGERDFSNELSGAGTLTTAGTITLSGDASAHTGTTNVESGTLTVAETAKLGTGDFEVSGTLALNGDRDFANKLSGAGKLATNGNVNFSANVDGFTGTLAVEGGTLTVAQGKTLAVAGTLSVANGATLKLYGGDTLGAAVNVASGAAVSFADRAKLIIEVSTGQQVGFETSVMNWETDSSISGLSGLEKNANISFVVNGIELAADAWGFEVGETGLTVYTVGGITIISERDKDVVLDREINATFDPNLTEYIGKISGDGDVHSTGTLTFAGDASAHTGTTYIDGGTFTIVDAAKLGTGAFEVASAGTLRIEGTRDFSNKLSGAGTLTTAGAITLSGDASAHTGTTKVESGTLTIAESAKLGTGAFEIAGTLALNGDRTFANATSGNGEIEISTGSTTFATDIGVKTLSVSENATATLNSGIGLTHADANVELAGTLNLKGDRDFAATLSGAGELATNGNVNFTSDASAFTGKTSVNAGTFTVAESATLGTGAFDVAGTLALNGTRTFANATSGAGKIEVSTGTTTFATDIGVKTLSVSENATATLADNVGMTRADANVALAGTLNLNGNRDFATTLSGAGKLSTNGNVNFTSDASAFTGKTSVNAGTFTVAESAKLGTGAVEVAGTLALNGTRTFANTLSGAGTLTTAGAITLSGNASAHTGTTKVESGTLTVASGAKLGTGAFEVAGTLAINGDRTFANATSGAGKIEVATGSTNFTQNIGVKTLSVSQNATATLASGIGLTHADASVALAGTLNLKGDRDFATTLSGAGKLTTNGSVDFTSDASGFSGATKVESGTLTIAESAKLGTGDFEIAGTLAIGGDRTFKNATSGNGTISVMPNADVAFAKSIGVKKLSVADNAKLRGNVKMTHGADAVLELAGTLVLDAAAGEKVSLGNGKVVIKSTAALDLSGTSLAATLSTHAVVYDAVSTESALLSGDSVTIFESGTVDFDSGANVVRFLGSDATLRDLATRYAVVYDTSSGLRVQVLSSGTADTSIVDTQGLSASFVDWAFEKATSASLPVGIRSVSDIPSADDPLLNALLAGDAGTARAILDRLSPKSYAAMIAMPVETFHDDVRSISARLEQRRYDAPVRRGLSWEFFAQAQMISVDNDTAKSAPTFDFDRYGVLAGADVKLDPTMLVGIALGAGTGKAKIHNGGGKIESDDYRLNVFGGKTFAERFYVNAGAQLGFASYDVKRTTDYGNANASADGWNAGAFAETGAVLTISDEYKLYAMPYFGLAYTHAATDSFKESGSDAAFDADSLAGDSLRARLGCSFSWRFDVAGARWRVGLDVAYSHELLDDEIDVDVKATDNGSKISETAKALPENVFSIGPSVNVDLTRSASIYAGYSFNAGTDSATAHNANVGFRMRF